MEIQRYRRWELVRSMVVVAAANLCVRWGFFILSTEYAHRIVVHDHKPVGNRGQRTHQRRSTVRLGVNCSLLLSLLPHCIDQIIPIPLSGKWRYADKYL